MITKRDSDVIQFVEKMKIAKTSTLTPFYPSYKVSSRRLSTIVKNGELKRDRDGWSSEYLYYRSRPKQLRHALILSDFYRELASCVNVKKFIVEPVLGSIRPDAVAGYVKGGKEYIALVEVEISHKGFDAEKYEAFNWMNFFPVEPILIVISDFKIPEAKFKTIIVRTDFKDFKL
ncbi:MAG: hypothetical protein WCS30_14050 [Selenomonadaceae bacterium]